MDTAFIFLFLLFLAVALVTVCTAMLYSFVKTVALFRRGLGRLRFSLRTLMIAIITGGACASLVATEHTFPLGLICSEFYLTFLILYVLGMGAMQDSEIPQHVSGEH